ncbi:MAG: signal peptidase I [Clostridia bacterium]
MKIKKLFKTIYYIVFAFIILIAVLLIVSVLPITGNIKFLTVLSGSMEPAVKTGSIVLTKPVSDYKIGDIITFGPTTKTTPPTTHRIAEIKVVGGEPVYITKGDANNSVDSREIKKADIIGKTIIKVPYLGYVIDFVRKPIGFVLIIVVPAVVIINDEIRKIWKEIMRLKKKRKEKDIKQDEEINELKNEIKKVEEELKENEVDKL